MNLETRARDAAEGLRAATPVDAEDGLTRLHRTRQRRRTGKVVAALVAVVVGLGVVQLQRAQDRALPPVSPSHGWVLVSGAGEGSDWSEPLAEEGIQTYPYFVSADPATHRFLVLNRAGDAWRIMTPGRAEPLATTECGSPGCLAVAFGPGPDELTMLDRDLDLVVVGPDGRFRRSLGPAGPGMFRPAWSADGKTLAEAGFDLDGDEASLSVIQRNPDSAGVTTLYQYSEPAAPWYDVDQSDKSDESTGLGWGSPAVVDLQWAPGSTRLEFITMTVSDLAYQGKGGDHNSYQLRLFVADTATGQVDEIAELGRCACLSYAPYVAWQPDGKRLTVLTESSLATYDLTGKELDSEPTQIQGPLVWLQTE